MSWFSGSGSDKRLKVKGLVDLEPPKRPERDPNLPAPEQVNEVHTEVKKALQDEDNHKLGVLFEDLLDDMHSSKSRAHEKIPATLTEKIAVVCPELNAALHGELKILGRADARWGWAYQLDDSGFHVLARDPEKEGWRFSADEKAVLKAIHECKGDARHVAGVLVGRARRDILQSRTSWHLGAQIPIGGTA